MPDADGMVLALAGFNSMYPLGKKKKIQRRLGSSTFACLKILNLKIPMWGAYCTATWLATSICLNVLISPDGFLIHHVIYQSI